jgi:HEPN domain-containing protein
MEIAEEWLRRSRSNLTRCLQPRSTEVYFVDLCLDAQQSAEKSIKAVFILLGKSFSESEHLKQLLESLASFIPNIPEDVRLLSDLTDYTLVTRYPNWCPRVTEEEFERALSLAQAVLDFVGLHFAEAKSQTSPN